MNLSRTDIAPRCRYDIYIFFLHARRGNLFLQTWPVIFIVDEMRKNANPAKKRITQYSLSFALCVTSIYAFHRDNSKRISLRGPDVTTGKDRLLGSLLGE